MRALNWVKMHPVGSGVDADRSKEVMNPKASCRLLRQPVLQPLHGCSSYLIHKGIMPQGLLGMRAKDANGAPGRVSMTWKAGCWLIILWVIYSCAACVVRDAHTCTCPPSFPPFFLCLVCPSALGA